MFEFQQKEDDYMIIHSGSIFYFKQSNHNPEPYNETIISSNDTIGHTTSTVLLPLKQLLEQAREADILPVNTIHY